MQMLQAWISRIALLAGLGVLAAACAAVSSDEDVAAPEGETSTDEAGVGEAEPPSDDPPPWPWERAAQGEDVPASVPLEEIRSGGPPPAQGR